jgi:leucyl/phenylalanyl-tRNA---protein transferase
MQTDPANPVEALLTAYRQGYFPMADPDARGRHAGRIRWFNPDPRGIIPIEPADIETSFHIPRRLRDRVRSGRFEITSDTAFCEVITACAAPRRAEPKSWIDATIIEAYTALHSAGHASSIEAWLPGDGDRVLVGGLYGVRIGAAFFAESKFSRPALGGTDASKVCLVHLVLHLRRRGYTLLDTQFWNPHIAQFGCTEIPRDEYLARLAAAVDRQVTWGPFEPRIDGM